MIYISEEKIDHENYEIENDKEDPYTLDERYWDDSYYCPYCKERKIKDYIIDSAYGTTVRIPVWICPNCE